MSSITSYATTPPACGEKCFERIGKSIPVYVPMYSISAYKQAEGWKEFTNILPIAAEDVPIIEPIITTDDYSVTIIWPQNEDADTYTIEITKDGVVFCTLKFNAQGQLVGIAFAPGINGNHRAPAAVMTTNGWQFTVTGLNQASKYTYKMDVTDASKQVIKSYKGEFATDGYTDLLTLPYKENASGLNKFIQNGQLYILRDGKTYTVQGVEIE